MNQIFKISVIIPFYNGNKYLSKLFQTLENNYIELKAEYPYSVLETIIVNDSPDVKVEIPSICVSFRYDIVVHKKNQGIQQARVTGLENSKGDYILFLDQDDELLKDAIVRQVDLIQREHVDMVICNAYIENADNELHLLYKKNIDLKRLYDLNFFLKSHNIIKSPGQCLIRKQSIPIEWKKYIMKKNGSDDLFLWILMFEKKCKIAVNSIPLYIHKYTGENLSNSDKKMTVSSLEIVEILSKIKYVPFNDITCLKRAREFSLGFKSNCLIRKIVSAYKYFDVFMYLTYEKIKQIVSE